MILYLPFDSSCLGTSSSSAIGMFNSSGSFSPSSVCPIGFRFMIYLSKMQQFALHSRENEIIMVTSLNR